MSVADAAPSPAPRAVVGARASTVAWCAGVSTAAASVLTNPLEVVKTRLQVQGELEPAHRATRTYRGMVHGLTTIARQEGWAGLQGGLTAALGFNFVMNSVRMGLYTGLKDRITGGQDVALGGAQQLTPTLLAQRVVAGTAAGMVGGALGSPFFLVKARLQAQSPHFPRPNQRLYTGAFDAFRDIVRTEGWSGLARGWSTQVARIGTGGCAQMAVYDCSKSLVVGGGWGRPDDVRVHVLCSALASVGVVAIATPADVVASRMYCDAANLYRGAWDCLVRTVRVEGWWALYRGWSPRLVRTAPHTLLTFVLFEQALAVAQRVGWQ